MLPPPHEGTSTRVFGMSCLIWLSPLVSTEEDEEDDERASLTLLTF